MHPKLLLPTLSASYPFCRARAGRGRPGGWLLALLLLAVLSGAATTALGQGTPPPECAADEKFANTWYFGHKAGLDFNMATDSIPPKVLTDGAMVAPAGAGVMCDANGKILFYSNGDTIWNGDHTIMTNGTGMGGSRLVTDGPLPIRMPGKVNPGESTRYLIFTQDAAGGPRGLSYSEIVIPPGGGAGTVTAATKNKHLAYGTTEKMTAVFHKNGCDIWIIVHGWGDAKTGPDNRGDAFLAYRVRVGGVIDPPVISTVGSLHASSESPVGYKGQMKITPDGGQLAVARYSEALGDSTGTVELFSFDTNTGQVSADPKQPYIIDSGEGKYYGVDFVPGRKLFATVMNPPKLLQFDISGQGPVNKQDIPLKQTTTFNLGSLQTAPDGKIYVARDGGAALGFIPYPDSVGAAVGYADDSLKLEGRRSGLGLVNFNQSSLLRFGFGAESTACLEMTFTTAPVDFDNATYTWDFGDGTTSKEQNPKHTFPKPGDYVVTLRIDTDCFCRQAQYLVRVPGEPTPGSIADNQTVCLGAPLAPIVSTAPAGAGTGEYTYQWQSSPTNQPNDWTDIGGATSESYTPPTPGTPGTYYFRRLVTSGFCEPRTPTASVRIIVLPALVGGSIEADQTVCAGSPVAPLTSTTPVTGGSGQFVFQWEASTDGGTNWVPISGATAETYAPGTLKVTTLFRRRVSAGPCAEESNVVTVTVVPSLAAGTIGSDQAICAGNTPTRLIGEPASGGAGTVAYQWESSTDNKTWTAIGQASGPTYAPGALTVTTYFRRVAGSGAACAPAISNVVTIDVTPELLAGTIAADQTICANTAPAPLTSTTDAKGGKGTITYQWESSADNASWNAVEGATGPTLAPGPLTGTTYFRRRAAAAGACTPEVSNVVTILVTPVLTAGTIGTNQALCAGGTPTPLTSQTPAAGGTSTITYQWESSADNATWTAIAGATGPNFEPGALTATTYYRRQATSGACGPVASNVVAITVTPALTAGTIAADQTLCPDATPARLTSTASAGGGTGTFAYQWESSPNNANWTPVVGATGAEYAPGPLAGTTYFRRRVASGACGPLYSNTVVLQVLPALTAGTIAADQTICANTAPTPLTSTGEAGGGTGTYAYQWESSADNASWAPVGGATGPTLAPGPLTATTYFRRRVTSGTGTCATAVSNVVTITVQPLVTPTVTLAQPPVQCPGTPLTFTAVVANAGASPTIQWFVNNVAAATGPVFTSSTLVTGDQVRVEVTPTAGLCGTARAVATVTVSRTPTPLPTLAIAVQPGGPVCLGEPLTFNVASVTEAGPAPGYQWQVNGADVPNATGPVFTSTALREGQIVTLRLRTTNACGQPLTVVSNGIPVRIQPPVDVDAGPDKEILAGSSVVLEGRADGTYPVTWAPLTGLTFQGSDQLHPVAAPTETTTYTLSAGSGGCADSDQVTVTVRPAIRIPNAFTPNGDGRDDTWQIEFIEQFPDNTVTVYNRWGNKIFSAENYSRANEWRGDINGKPAPVGTYYYIVVTKGPLGRSYSGPITILY